MKKTMIFSLLFLTALLFSDGLTFTAKDKPNDDGSAIVLEWDYTSPYASMLIEHSKDGINFTTIQEPTRAQGSMDFTDGIIPKEKQLYRFSIMDEEGNIIQQKKVETMAKIQYFNTDNISLLLMVLLISGSIGFYILSAKSGKELYLRKINGLESMDESVGRATEMGRPILFIPGTLDLDDMQTISGLTILGKLAQKAAEYDAQLLVPVCRSMVLSTAKEIVKEAYLKAGRPDAFREDSVFYLTDDQFGFVAGVDGIIVREKPAANFFMGAFYAESLILAETGFASGAIQTAGTAMPSQLPFFVAACDYTLIGEELFAASAYLSKEPHQLGSLKGQDFGKAIIMVTIVVGVILEMFGVHFIKDFLTMH